MKAADVRRDAVWQNLQSQEASHPCGAYHRRYYQTYTHKKALDRIRKCRDSQAETSISDDASTLDKAADSQVPELGLWPKTKIVKGKGRVNPFQSV